SRVHRPLPRHQTRLHLLPPLARDAARAQIRANQLPPHPLRHLAADPPPLPHPEPNQLDQKLLPLHLLLQQRPDPPRHHQRPESLWNRNRQHPPPNLAPLLHPPPLVHRLPRPPLRSQAAPAPLRPRPGWPKQRHRPPIFRPPLLQLRGPSNGRNLALQPLQSLSIRWPPRRTALVHSPRQTEFELQQPRL